MPANTMTVNTTTDNDALPRRGVGRRSETAVDHAQGGEMAAVPKATCALLFGAVMAAVTVGNAPGFHQGGRISRRRRHCSGGSR